MSDIFSNILEIEARLKEIREKKRQTEEKLSQAKHKQGINNALHEQIDSLKRILKTDLSNLQRYQNMKHDLEQRHLNITEAQDRWVSTAGPVARKAAMAGVRITMNPNGYYMTDADDMRTGLYVSNNEKSTTEVDSSCEPAIKHHLSNCCEEILPTYKRFAEANKAFWTAVDKYMEKRDFVPDWDMEHDTSAKIIRVLSDNEARFTTAPDKTRARIAEKEKDLNDGIDNEVISLTTAIKNAEAEINDKTSTLQRLRRKLVEVDPLMAGTFEKLDGEWIERVKQAAEKRERLTYIPTLVKQQPYYCWEASLDNKHIMVRNVGGDFFWHMNYLVTAILLAMPVRSVHVTFIDIASASGYFANLIKNCPNICTMLYRSNDINEELNRLQDRHHSPDGRHPTKKEIIVLVGYDADNFRNYMEQIKSLIRNDCADSGIHFIAVPTVEYKEEEDKYRDCFSKEIFVSDHTVLQKEATLMENGEKGSLKALVEQYIQREAKVIHNKVYPLVANGTLFNSEPETNATVISASVAECADGNEITVKFATKDNFHTFIIGRSGSGKSYLLHSLLTNIMLKYDQDIVEFTLMDFKMGGVELNYYKDLPHVNKLLVNGSDRQIVGQIINNLRNDMARRGEMLHNAGVTNIDEYNDKMPAGQRMRHIILLVDECQELFNGSDQIYENVSETVTRIAKEGRSQGVHLVFATQQLEGTRIPRSAISQFTDFLLMNCSADDVAACNIKDAMVKSEVPLLAKGEVIHYQNGRALRGFVYDYAGSDAEKDKFKNKTKKVLASRKRAGAPPQFYFDAQQLFRLNPKDLCARLKKARSRAPMALLGRTLTVEDNSLSVKFMREEGCNMLITGMNQNLQAERILWNAVLSLKASCRLSRTKAKFLVLNTFRDAYDGSAVNEANQRDNMLRALDTAGEIQIIEEYDRANTIADLAAELRRRQAEGMTEQDGYMFLIMPNQELFHKKMKTHGNRKTNVPQQPSKTEQPTLDSLGFAEIATIPMDRPTQVSNGGRGSVGNGTIEEDLLQLLNEGSDYCLFTIIQASSPDKIFDSYQPGTKTFTDLFRDIIVLRLDGNLGRYLPINERDYTSLNTDRNRLRAIRYNPEQETGGIETFIPYDMPDMDVVRAICEL